MTDMDTLKRWNNLVDENLTEGKFLVVGFISNKRALLASAAYQLSLTNTMPNPNVYDAAKFVRRF